MKRALSHIADPQSHIAHREAIITPRKSPVALSIAQLLCFVVPLLLLLVSAWHMGAFWTDEAEMANWSAKPLPELIESLRLQITPLAYPLLAKFWLLPFGFLGQQGACRVLGVCLGMGAVVLVSLVGRRFAVKPGSTRSFVPLASAVVLTTPMLVRILGTNRAYGLSSLALAGLVLCVLHFIRDDSRKALFGAVGFALLALHSHYLNLFPVLTVMGAVLVATGRRGWRLALPLTGAILSLAVYVPWVLAARQWTVIVREGRNLRDIVLPLQWLLNTGFQALPWICALIWLVGLGLLLKAVRSAEGRRREMLKFALCTAAVCPWVSIAGMWLAGTGGMQWYYVPPLVVCACCLQLGFTFEPGARRTLAWAGTTALVTANACSARPLLQPIGQADRLAAYVQQHAAPDDLVIVCPWWVGVSFGYYYRGPAPWSTAPALADTSLIRYDLANAATQNPELLNQLLDRIYAKLKSGGRVFLVGGQISTSAPPADDDYSPPAEFQRRVAEWNMAVVGLLEQHSQSLNSLDTNTDGTNSFETFPVYIYQGWHDQPAKGQFVH